MKRASRSLDKKSVLFAIKVFGMRSTATLLVLTALLFSLGAYRAPLASAWQAAEAPATGIVPAQTAEEKEKAQEATVPTTLPVDLDAITAFAKKISSRKFSRLSTEMVELITPVITSVSPSTVRIYSGKDQIAIGTVIGSDGFILTVASELKKDIECRLPDGTSKPASVFGVDQESGLALLKIETTGLSALALLPRAVPEVGSWIASVSPDQHPVAIGVVSVAERKIVGGGAFIGIRQAPGQNSSRGILIDEVTANSPADKADIRIGDRIVQVSGKEVATMLDVQKILRERSPGDELEIVILRGGKEQTVKLILAARDKFDTLLNEQDRMGSVLSKRRQGFPSAFQHDSFLQAKDCGSPIVDLDGQVVGVNISRSGRVSSLALPLDIVLPAIERLRSGNLSPAIINAKRIEQVTAELDSLMKEVDPLSAKIGDSDNVLSKHDDKIEALKSVQADLDKRLQEMLAEKEQKKDEIKEVRKRMAEIQVKAKRLRDELEALKSGANAR
jgi:serine protease Do